MSKRSRGVSIFALCALAVPLLGPSAAPADEVCGNPGADDTMVLPGDGIINSYLEPASASADLAAGSTSVEISAITGFNPSPLPALKFGDLLLFIQMQGADFNSNNDNRYGDGVQEVSPTPDAASGITGLAGAGLYEYAVVSDGLTPSGTPVAPFPGVVPIRGAAPGGGLLNSYRNEDYNAASHTFGAESHGPHGRRRYQVVRVPQFSSFTLTSAITCRYWDGVTGGILALDVSGQIDLGTATASVSGRGFRGGWGQRLTGGTGGADADFTNTTAANFHGNKGEGIAGTPRFLLNPQDGSQVDNVVEGYPGGIRARGAPGNAGGGGNTGNISNNDESAGGGGGGNGGAGGRGGNTRISNEPFGGFGGTVFPWAVNRVVMGGGGGSGCKNDASPNESHGGAGGGIVMFRVGSVTGAGTIAANGLDGVDTGNDGGGGGGAGGTVVLVTKTGDWTGLTVQANGGAGADSGTGTSLDGPGGGGGGGVILSNQPVNSASATSGGAPGLTGNGTTSYGASSGPGGTGDPGDPGNPLIDPDDIPGAISGADCATNDPPVNSVPGAQSTPQDTALFFTAANGNLISISDPDAGTSLVEVDLSVTNGTLTLSGTAGLVFTVGDGTDDTTMTFRGTIADINAALNGMRFDPPTGFTSPPDVTFTIQTDDLGNTGTGGAMTDTDAVLITVGAVNDPPVNAVPGAQAVDEDATLVLSTANSNRISISDPDAGGASVEVTLTVTTGTLTLNGVIGLTFSPGSDGVDDASMTFTGTIADINTALDGLQYEPPPDFFTNPPLVPLVTLTITTDDLGNTGPGGAKTDTDTVTLTVNPVNDAPVAAGDSFTASELSTLSVPASGVLANDTDVEGSTLTAAIVTTTSNGALTLNADGSFTYTPNAGFIGTDSFTYQASDGAAASAAATVTILVGAVDKHLKAGYCWSSVSTAGEIRWAFLALASLGVLFLPGLRRRREGSSL